MFMNDELNYTNPVKQVLEEANQVFPNRKIACIVRIGTGLTGYVKFPASSKTDPLVNILKNMATEPENIAKGVRGLFNTVSNAYF
jgi:hypothetical protein